MKERPIIFSAPMVRAILDGRKTMTRRVVKLPEIISEPGDADATSVGWLDHHESGPGWHGWMTEYPEEGSVPLRCPYGQPGDRLWVRETFLHYPADYCWEASVSIPSRPAVTIYRADADPTGSGTAGWKSPIHMPRSLSRITLEIESVRVERLQDISEADAMAEGCAPNDECEQGSIDPGTGRLVDAWKYKAGTAAESFCNRWERTHEKRLGDHGWTANPWVWVLAFKRVMR